MFGFFKNRLSEELLKEVSFYEEALRQLEVQDPVAASKVCEGARTIWPKVLSNLDPTAAFDKVGRIAFYKGLEEAAEQLSRRGDNTRGTGIKIVTIWLRTSLLEDAPANAAHHKAARLLQGFHLEVPEIQTAPA